MEEFLQKFEQILKNVTFVVAKGVAEGAKLYWIHNTEKYIDEEHTVPAHTTGFYLENIAVVEQNRQINDVWIQVRNAAPYAAVLEEGGQVAPTLAEIMDWAEQKQERYGVYFDAEKIWKQILKEGIKEWRLAGKSTDDLVRSLDSIVVFMLEKAFEVRE
jgi:hypothetical protein